MPETALPCTFPTASDLLPAGSNGYLDRTFLESLRRRFHDIGEASMDAFEANGSFEDAQAVIHSFFQDELLGIQGKIKGQPETIIWKPLKEVSKLYEAAAQCTSDYLGSMTSASSRMTGTREAKTVFEEEITKLAERWQPRSGTYNYYDEEQRMELRNRISSSVLPPSRHVPPSSHTGHFPISATSDGEDKLTRPLTPSSVSSHPSSPQATDL